MPKVKPTKSRRPPRVEKQVWQADTARAKSKSSGAVTRKKRISGAVPQLYRNDVAFDMWARRCASMYSAAHISEECVLWWHSIPTGFTEPVSTKEALVGHHCTLQEITTKRPGQLAQPTNIIPELSSRVYFTTRHQHRCFIAPLILV